MTGRRSSVFAALRPLYSFCFPVLDSSPHAVAELGNHSSALSLLSVASCAAGLPQVARTGQSLSAYLFVGQPGSTCLSLERASLAA